MQICYDKRSIEKDVSEAAVSKIRDLVGDCLFVDNREENSDINGSYWVFRIASYGFLAIISLITVLNITNSISMGGICKDKAIWSYACCWYGKRTGCEDDNC